MADRFPLLTDELIDEEWFAVHALNVNNVAKARIHGRAIESATRAPLLAEIERLTAERDAANKALAAQAQAEPVAWPCNGCANHPSNAGDTGKFDRFTAPQPAAQPVAVPAMTPGYVPVPPQVVEDALTALGHFVSDLGWDDFDMQAMDNLDAYMAQHKARQAAAPRGCAV